MIFSSLERYGFSKNLPVIASNLIGLSNEPGLSMSFVDLGSIITLAIFQSLGTYPLRWYTFIRYGSFRRALLSSSCGVLALPLSALGVFLGFNLSMAAATSYGENALLSGPLEASIG